jgi:acyl-CoA reductase-like NAD-dependent aldehyde dehydrogenase
MEGGDRVDIDADEEHLRDVEDEEHGGEGHQLVGDPPDERENEEDQRRDREGKAEGPMGVEVPRAEDAQTGKEELDDHADEVDRREPEQEEPGLRHGLDSTRPARRQRDIVTAMAVATEREYLLFIDGEEAEPSDGEVRELSEPATGKPLAKAAVAGPADVDRAVAAARSALEGAWGKTPANERSRLLHALADAIVAVRKELAELETRNVGKALSSSKPEVIVAAESFRFMASAVGAIEGGTRPIGGSILSYTLKEPVGVCAQIVPWNYPIMLAAWKLAPALAAGCTVVLKPDPATPLTAVRLAELAVQVGIPAGVVNVVPGEGTTAGSHLVGHPDVDKVAFTGSTATGSEIMRLCADPVKRVSLELGGKSPAIVFADADLEDAIASSTYGTYYSAGQSCDARSRLLVEQAVYDEVVSRVAEKAAAVRVGDPLDPETQMGSLISREHREKVHGFVEAGREEGAEVVAGGEPSDGDGAFYPATVLSQVGSEADVAQEEIFGPVVVAIPFEDEDDAVRIANDVRYGLLATVWTKDSARGHRLARRVKSGTFTINMPYGAFPGIPFGGYKQSGFGREQGLETLQMYLETKSVIFATGARPTNPWGL